MILCIRCIQKTTTINKKKHEKIEFSFAADQRGGVGKFRVAWEFTSLILFYGIFTKLGIVMRKLFAQNQHDNNVKSSLRDNSALGSSNITPVRLTNNRRYDSQTYRYQSLRDNSALGSSNIMPVRLTNNRRYDSQTYRYQSLVNGCD